MNGRELGKISKVWFGVGGYQDCMFGLTLTLEGKGWGVGDFISGGWDVERMPRSEYAKWTEADRDEQMVKMCRRISKLLSDAKVDDIAKLKGIPIEVVFECNALKEWRILTEVL